MLMEADDLMEDFFTIRLSNQNTYPKTLFLYYAYLTYVVMLPDTKSQLLWPS